MANLLLMQLGAKRFSRGKGTRADACTVRTRYICALKRLGSPEVGPLLTFALS